jgi:predicted DNA-binding protein (UPF0251 family)
VLPPLALSQKDAAAALGISVNHFKKHVRPALNPVYIAGSTRYKVAELQQYLDLC